MPTADARAAEFDVHRRYLTTVAYRMLGSYADAEDAVQEAWFRLAGTDAPIEDLRAWLVRVVSRVSLDRLRSRTRHPENPLDALPDVETADAGPADRAETADRVGYALMLVLERLSPDERLAYVLHDVFGLPFDDIADAVDRTPQAARKLGWQPAPPSSAASPSATRSRSWRSATATVCCPRRPAPRHPCSSSPAQATASRASRPVCSPPDRPGREAHARRAARRNRGTRSARCKARTFCAERQVPKLAGCLRSLPPRRLPAPGRSRTASLSR